MRPFLIRFALFGLALLVVLEIVLRTALPAADMPFGRQLEEYGIMALDSSGGESGRNSVGRFCRPVFTWRINNAGFNSAWDYRGPAERDRPCAVVIGNSYVQGLYGDPDEHLAARVQDGMHGAVEVYNLGTSGMPLSQVPLVLSYAVEKYDPELVIVLSGTGSVTGSLRERGRVPYSQQFSVQGSEVTPVPPSRFTVNRRNRLARHSALVRYLFYNASYNFGGKGLAVDAQTRRDRPDELDGALDLAVGASLDAIRAAAPAARLLVLTDADRQAMYGSGQRPPRLPDSARLEEACRARNIGFLDLTGTFWQEYAREGRRLNFRDNYHWNPYAVGIAARAILDHLAGRPVAD